MLDMYTYIAKKMNIPIKVAKAKSFYVCYSGISLYTPKDDSENELKKFYDSVIRVLEGK